MSIISILIREFIPDLVPLLNEKTDHYSDFISNNFITKNLINLFTNKYIDENLSLFIWDLLFINGNLTLIRSFLGIYNFLAPSLIESNHSVEEFLSFVDNNLKKLKPDNEELLHYLFINDYNFIENEINEARFSLSSKFAKNINDSYNEENNKIKYKKKLTDKKKCNKNWPICTCDNFDQKNVIFFSVFRKHNNGKYIEDYFLNKFNEDNKKEENKNKDSEEMDIDDLLIERRKHFCFDENNDDKNGNNNEENSLKDMKDEDIDDECNKKINYQKIINNPEFVRAKMNIMNNFKLNQSPQ